VSRPATAATTVIQRLVKSGSKDFHKRQALRDLITAEDAEIKNGIIFCNRKTTVSELFRSLTRHGFDAGALHGDMDQRARMAMLAGFRDGKLKLLVASDVAARGLDIPDVSHVFNYDVPIHSEDYVHRIGRTGRAGRSGKAFTIVSKPDLRYVQAIEKLTGIPIEWLDGDLSTLVLPAEEDDGHDERRGRGRAKAAPKGRSERKPRAERAPKAPPAEPAPAEEAKVEPAPRPERREAIRAENDKRVADRKAVEPAPKRDVRRRSDRDDAPETRVGFGDDMPDFMKIVVRV
jgi:superfamily II DNA/RNA helicase